MGYRSRRDRYFGGGWGGWAPYVPVAQRRAQAADYGKKLAKKRGTSLAPIAISSRKIATTFWGKAWCDHIELFSDFSNRLPRGQTYVRNGSVIDLQIEKGKISALVSGSEVYTIAITIDTLPAKAWQAIQKECSQSIASLLDLLQGRFDQGIMARLTHAKEGLLPQPREIKMKCSCPDYAGLCKHLAAVLYGVGARLDEAPELLFTLRNVNHLDLIQQAVTTDNIDRALQGDAGESLQVNDLGQMFGIELDSTTPDALPSKRRPAKDSAKKAPTKPSSKPVPKKSPAAKTSVKARAKSAALRAKRRSKATTASTSAAPKSSRHRRTDD